MEYLKLSGTESLAKIDSTEGGLSTSKAKDRLRTYGFNAFKKNKNTALAILLRQFNNAIIYLLLAACIASYFAKSYTDTYIIGAVLLTNALLGFFQEYRSERTLQRLAALVTHTVLVRRDGATKLISQDDLVPGDIVILKEGDIVPADCKVLEADNFSANESQLTGESAPITKQPGTDEASLVYAGSISDSGKATVLVYATGDSTKLGKIATLSRTTKRVTPYEKSLQSFSYLLMKIALPIIPLIFLIKIFVLHGSVGLSESLVFMFSFAIAVVPEALPAVVSVTLASGALQLSRQSVLVKKLSSIEDLGNITVLCTDKTGTLTENKLAITEIVADDPVWFQILGNASIEVVDEKRNLLANAFDEAFAAYLPPALKARVGQFKKLRELPFDPKGRRRRIVLEDCSDGNHWMVNIGSAETLYNEAATGKKQGYLEEIADDGKKGLRHLGISAREVEYNDHFDILAHEKEMQFIGFVKLTDSLKPTAKSTIEAAQRLGVQVKILTGDSVEVAEYVGRQIGLVKEGERVYSGDEIEKMTPELLRGVLPNAHVFARVTPEQKYAIIKLLKEMGEVVGYQGDGINDAPSLKLADVSIAVDTASDVAKDSADILLLQSDLNVVIAGIKNGRAVFSNVNKYIRYTMVGNFSSFFTLATLYLFGSDLPLLPTQLLIVSTFTQLPLTTVSNDTVQDDALSHPNRYDIRSIMFLALVLGTVTTFCQLIFFAFVKGQVLGVSQTALTLYLTLVQLVVIFPVRNRDWMWKASRPSTTFATAMAITIAVSIAMIYIPPLKDWFSFAPLSPGILGWTLGATLGYVLVIDAVKVWYYRLPRKILPLPVVQNQIIK